MHPELNNEKGRAHMCTLTLHSCSRAVTDRNVNKQVFVHVRTYKLWEPLLVSAPSASIIGLCSTTPASVAGHYMYMHV